MATTLAHGSTCCGDIFWTLASYTTFPTYVNDDDDDDDDDDGEEKP